MNKTAKTILWIVVIAAVIYFGYKAYKKANPTVGTGGLVSPNPVAPASNVQYSSGNVQAL